MVSHNGNIRHSARSVLRPAAVGPYWAVFTGRHSAGRHSGTHPFISHYNGQELS